MSKRFTVGVVLAWALLLGLTYALLTGKMDDRLPVDSGLAKDVITFWSGELIGTPEERALREVTDAYNRRHPDVHVEAVLMPYATYRAKINLAVATGQPPDVCQNAMVIVESLRAKQKVPDLAVPIPDDMIPPELRKKYGRACVAGVSRGGRMYSFPFIKYVFASTLWANYDWFEKAGIDVDYYIEHGWDYATFRQVLKKVQVVMRREKGEDAYAFGNGLNILDDLLYQSIFWSAVGKESAERYFLHYDAARRRYVLDPLLTPEKVAEPLRLIQQLIHVDKTWGKRSLGMDYAQLGQDCNIRGLTGVIFSNTPGNSMYAQVVHMDEYKRGILDKPVRTTNLPVPVPRKGMERVFLGGADGYGVMRQMPYKGDKHTRRALEFAQYLSSPEALARIFKASGKHVNPWPDEAAVQAAAKGVRDPMLEDPRLRRQWDVYLKWLDSPMVCRPDRAWPEQDTRQMIIECINRYLSGPGHQIAERVVYNQVDPLDAARELLSGLRRAIDDFYRERKRTRT